jgi:hypothetical protein
MCMCMYVHAHVSTLSYQYGSQADHPFIIQLVCTYADLTHVYFLLTPALGGEVFHQHSSD